MIHSISFVLCFFLLFCYFVCDRAAFSRNHHEPQESQEPYLWASVEAVAKKVLAMRYSLLPTLYTLLANVHQNGGTVARSLMFNFPTDSNTWAIDHQFMWADVVSFSASELRHQKAPAQGSVESMREHAELEK